MSTRSSRVVYVANVEGGLLGVRETLIQSVFTIKQFMLDQMLTALQVEKCRWEVSAWDTQGSRIVLVGANGWPNLEHLVTMEKAVDAYTLTGKLHGVTNL